MGKTKQGTYIPLFLNTIDETEDLTDEEFGRLIRAIGLYAKGSEDYESKIVGNEKYAFKFLKGQVDRNMEISRTRSEAGSIKANQNTSNEIKTNQNESNPPKEKEKEKEKENKKRERERKDDLFERFWLAYPRHEAKATAKAEFEKLNPTEELLQIMLGAIEKQKKTTQWNENGGQFIPHPRTWLHQHRWEDEVSEGKPKTTVVAQQYTQRDEDYSKEVSDRADEIYFEMIAKGQNPNYADAFTQAQDEIRKRRQGGVA